MEKSKLSMIAFILGIIALIFMASAILGMDTPTDSAEQIGASIGFAIILPSIISTTVAVLLNGIGYFTINKTVTLVSTIFYVIGLILMPLWGFLGIPSMILQFIAFTKMKKTVY